MPRVLKVYVPAKLAQDFQARHRIDRSRSSAIAPLAQQGAGWHMITAPLGRRLMEDARVRAFDPNTSTPTPTRRYYQAFYYQLQRQLESFGELTQEDRVTMDLRCLVRVWAIKRKP